MLEKWFPYQKSIHENIVVYCIGHAGSSAIQYLWEQNQHVVFEPVELPGRGTRRKEKAITDFKKLTHKISEAIAYKCLKTNTQFILYGHSMGGLLCFEVAHNLCNDYNIYPKSLIISGCESPNHVEKLGIENVMNDDFLIRELREQGGTSDEILNNKEFMKYIIPYVRADYLLIETYEYNCKKVDVPIIVHYGNDDKKMKYTHLLKWKDATNSKFKIDKFFGGHFFNMEIGSNYQKRLLDLITSYQMV